VTLGALRADAVADVPQPVARSAWRRLNAPVRPDADPDRAVSFRTRLFSAGHHIHPLPQ